MTYSGQRFHRIREIFSLKPEGHVDQTDQNRNLQERADDGGKRLPMILESTPAMKGIPK